LGSVTSPLADTLQHTLGDAYDQPPPAHRGLVEDAKKRLATLEKTDAPPRRAVSAQ